MVIDLLCLLYAGVVQFQQSYYPGRVYAEAPPQVYVLAVSACYFRSTGCDASLPVEYILNGFDGETFSIHRQTGQVHTARSITRPLGASYQFEVFASANGMLARATIVITVSAYNEHPPSFPTQPHTAHAYRFWPNGKYVTTIKASDADEEEYNRVVIYNVIGGTGAFSLAINSETGEIVKSTEFPPGNEVNLIVEGENPGSPRLSSQTFVTVKLTLMSGK